MAQKDNETIPNKKRKARPKLPVTQNSLKHQVKDEVIRAAHILTLSPNEFEKKVSDPNASMLVKILGTAVQGYASKSSIDKKTHWGVIENFIDRSCGKPSLVKADENDENKTTFTLNYNFEKKGQENESEDEPQGESKSITTTGN